MKYLAQYYVKIYSHSQQQAIQLDLLTSTGFCSSSSLVVVSVSSSSSPSSSSLASLAACSSLSLSSLRRRFNSCFSLLASSFFLSSSSLFFLSLAARNRTCYIQLSGLAIAYGKTDRQTVSVIAWEMKDRHIAHTPSKYHCGRGLE